ncbi:adenosylmethionine-8-amino-7-oxononanoate aminotransferase-like protein [Trichoderma citrinoviride]|uniref:Adenosylmethionine-8-amino-7-oxononanoate aminotransferase-like protein n=1 Tax=Trichoderma citrinoviride TaxID=58853 RepID=A0A2T4B0D9_9HYPO|nr:adenosylmethionine-8-amino-7-oxononanoate aminotransferase-like protein [Trichoderma citrinoviride]PTB62785.1 adenosylmethionine-8-amino-7-oxononanoate aminotransferase-like protein [Trichoderma citrinoviride]
MLSETITAAVDTVLHRDLKHAPFRVVSSSGLYIYFDNGRKILDATGGAAVSCIGHGDERVIAAIVAQAMTLDYCHTMFYSCPSAEDLCKQLIQSTGGQMARAFIVCSGSEAMEAAMKLCRQYFLELPTPEPTRTHFIARRESYHGTTLGALSVGGHVGRRAAYEPILMQNVSHVSPCNPYRNKLDSESTAEYVERLAQELDAEFQRVGAHNVCAFIAEPVVGAALGCVPAVEGYFKAMKAVCDKHGALLVLDEVMCGMGRTGTMHAWEQEGVVPDIQTVGKGLGGGYAPIAGVLVGHRVIRTLEEGSGRFSHGHTYQAHPISCAAAAEVHRIILKEGLVDNVRHMGEYLGSLLKKRLGHHRHVGDVRGRGLFWGIEFVKDKASKAPFGRELDVGMLVHQKGLSLTEEGGILLYPGSGTVDGTLGDHILIAPPYNVRKSHIDLIVDLTVMAIEAAFGELECRLQNNL